MAAKRDHRVITLDVLELAAQTPDRDLAERLRQLLIVYSALVRCKEPSSTTAADHNGPRRQRAANASEAERTRCRRSRPQRPSQTEPGSQSPPCERQRLTVLTQDCIRLFATFDGFYS